MYVNFARTLWESSRQTLNKKSRVFIKITLPLADWTIEDELSVLFSVIVSLRTLRLSINGSGKRGILVRRELSRRSHNHWSLTGNKELSFDKGKTFVKNTNTYRDVGLMSSYLFYSSSSIVERRNVTEMRIPLNLSWDFSTSSLSLSWTSYHHVIPSWVPNQSSQLRTTHCAHFPQNINGNFPISARLTRNINEVKCVTINSFGDPGVACHALTHPARGLLWHLLYYTIYYIYYILLYILSTSTWALLTNLI